MITGADHNLAIRPCMIQTRKIIENSINFPLLSKLEIDTVFDDFLA